MSLPIPVWLQLFMEHARPRLLSNYDDLVAHYARQYMVQDERLL